MCGASQNDARSENIKPHGTAMCCVGTSESGCFYFVCFVCYVSSAPLCGMIGAKTTFSSLILSNFGDCPPFQGLNVSVCVAVCVHYGALQRRKMFEKTSDMPGDQAGIHSHPLSSHAESH